MIMELVMLVSERLSRMKWICWFSVFFLLSYYIEKFVPNKCLTIHSGCCRDPYCEDFCIGQAKFLETETKNIPEQIVG